MKAVFIIPPAGNKTKIPERLFGCSYVIYPMPNLAILYGASVIREKGIDVQIFDGTKMETNKFWQQLPKADYYLFNTVLLSQKDDIGIAKKLCKKSKIIFFGPQPTYAPKDFLLNENCFVARGESDFLLAEIILSKDPTKLRGVSYFKNKRIFHNKTWGIIENLDKLPFPARDLDAIQYQSLKLKEAKFTVLLASRQCAYRCYFCVPNSISWARELEWKNWAKKPGKPPVRVRSAKNIIEEVKELVNQGYREFSFIDDQFLWEKTRTLAITHGLAKLKIDYGILARADRLLDEEVVKALSASGCRYVDIGVESFNQGVLDDIKKDLKVETIKSSIELLNKYRIVPKLNIMFGTSALETEKMIKDYIQQTLKLPVSYCMYSIATPFPGTELAKKAKKRGWLLKNKNLLRDLDPAKTALMSLPKLPASTLESLLGEANRRFYLRPVFIIKQFLKIRSVTGLIKTIQGGARVLSKK